MFKLFLSYIFILLHFIRAYLIVCDRSTNLDATVRFADHQLPVINTRGDVLFKSFADIFDGNGGIMAGGARIYSFDGKNIMTDPHW